MNVDVDGILSRAERAVDAHGRFKRVPPFEPYLVLDRGGASLRMMVKLKGSRKKAAWIAGTGDTPELALARFIELLDVSVQAW